MRDLKPIMFFFDRLISELGLEKVDADIVAVLHLLPDAIPFTRALASVADIKGIIPKPKSINPDVQNVLSHLPVYDSLSRNTSFYLTHGLDRRTVFMDIGGYFSEYAKDTEVSYGDKFAGVVEDTENGLQKYIKKGVDFPFVSVARSPLKYGEDKMVGQAIAYSVEAILRESGIVLNGLKVGVIGYGKIGESVAQNISSRQGSVSIFDVNNIKLIQALSSGFETKNKLRMLAESDVVCLSTGNLSLSGDEYKFLKRGAWVFSVTSSDDEMNMAWLRENYEKEVVSKYVTKYTRENHYFYLLNDGNAINFVHGTTVGDFILLVHAELLVAAHKLLKGEIGTGGNHELDEATREKICSVWLDVFQKENLHTESDRSSELHKSAVKTLQEYAQKNPSENISLLLSYVEKTPESIKRSNIPPGHLTTSGLVISDGKILLIHHKSLNKFLQPGGHIEQEDASLLDAAKREVEEETGLQVKAHSVYGDVPLHLDMHTIPENKNKKEGQHSHYDCMFVFTLASHNDIVLDKSEVTGYEWVSADHDFKDPGIKAAVQKLKKSGVL